MEEKTRGLCAAKDGGAEVDDAALRLRRLLDALTETHNQIVKNAEAARLEIDSTFAALTKSLLEHAEKRKHELLRKVDAIQEDTLAPLTECRTNVENQLRRALDSKSGNQGARKSLDDSSISGLPEIPKPCDVPSISVRFDAADTRQCLASIACLGHVSCGEPIKIVECREKPGALAILWEESEIGFLVDVDDAQYRLQYCSGDAGPEEEYRDAYVGPDTCCVVRNLRPGVDHRFRVCRVVAGEAEWSRVCVAKTTVPPYGWEPSAGGDYVLSDGGSTATKEMPGPRPLHSDGAQFRRGHSLQFAVLDCGPREQPSEGPGTGLGLALEKIGEDGGPARAGTVFVSCEGEVFVDSIQTTTRLPRLRPGRTLTFESEEDDARPDRMRLMITCDGKRVTYDWRVGRCHRGVHFFMSVRDKGWRVKVE